MFKALIIAMCIFPSDTVPREIEIKEPPAKYRKDNVVRIEFLPEKAVQQKCQQLTGAREATACASVELMTMPLACGNSSKYAKIVCDTVGDKATFVTFPSTLPNPCSFKRGGEYADLMCHELGHVNGWSAKHPRK